jgi:3-oxo-5-alpha-steroid 4-dehydrogenase 1
MADYYDILLYSLLLISPIIFITLLFITAPYGRHTQSGWGLQMDNRWAWMWMELPAVLTMAIIYWINRENIHIGALVFLMIWEIHYVYRTFYFSYHLRASQKTFPLLLVLFAVFFNVLNGYLNGTYLFSIRPITSWSWFFHTHFWIGLSLFIFGFYLHTSSDRIILNLRSEGNIDYGIPHGGLFKYITNPNYFGEFIQWVGWAILTYSMAGLAFALFTLANLLPRAISNHHWYHKTFDDYPKKRKVFFPFIY